MSTFEYYEHYRHPSTPNFLRCPLRNALSHINSISPIPVSKIRTRVTTVSPVTIIVTIIFVNCSTRKAFITEQKHAFPWSPFVVPIEHRELRRKRALTLARDRGRSRRHARKQETRGRRQMKTVGGTSEKQSLGKREPRGGAGEETKVDGEHLVNGKVSRVLVKVAHRKA